ncbi:MAG: hypothetical protein ACWA5Q_03400 [bacterium]
MDVDNLSVPVLILSAGSEIVTVSLVDEFLDRGIPVFLLSLGKPSLFANSKCLHGYSQMNWPPVSFNEAFEDFLRILDGFGVGDSQPWPVYATDDGGLRFLFEAGPYLEDRVVFSRARSLPMGGLDKSELFGRLSDSGLDSCIPEYRVIDSHDSMDEALRSLLGTGVLKPSLKPYSMQVPGLDTKLEVVDGDMVGLSNKLDAYLEASHLWLLQNKIEFPQGQELDWYGVVDTTGEVRCESLAREIWKYPSEGGAGSWVILNCEIEAQIKSLVRKIIDATDLVGLVEISFLRDTEGRLWFLELNARPWLQVALPGKAGLPVAYESYLGLLGKPSSSPVCSGVTSWINIERAILAALSGEYGNPLKCLFSLFVELSRADYFAVYSTRQPGIKLKWVKRMLVKLFSP